MKKETSQLNIVGLILVTFVVLVAICYMFLSRASSIKGRMTSILVKTTIPPRSLTDCSDIAGGCLKQGDCKEGQSLQYCCNYYCSFLQKTGTCETGYRECKANTCCCICK